MVEEVFPVPTDSQDSISMRLRRIEGQIRGIQRMVESGRDCREIVNQVSAVKAALSSLNAVVLECYIRKCLNDPACSLENTTEDLLDMMLRATR